MVKRLNKKIRRIVVCILVFVLVAGGLGVWHSRRVGKIAKDLTLPIEKDTQIQSIKIFLIALEDNGKMGKLVGCGDSAVAVNREIVPTKAVLKRALEELLSFKDKYYGENKLYNALYKSGLRIDTVTLTENKVKIELSGGYRFKGVCEDARFKAQIEETAKQFPSVKEVEIFVN